MPSMNTVGQQPLPPNCIVLLGPTAVGKTALGVRIAIATAAHILSADSRQVYRGLDIGSGKDLADYTVDGTSVPYHLIDIADLAHEYNVFNYQQDFYAVFAGLQKKNILPLVVGGTGLYLDAVVRNYDLLDVPKDETLRSGLAEKTLDELDGILLNLKPELHNKTDLLQRQRVVRAIEIEAYMRSESLVEKRKKMVPRPDVRPLVIGSTLPRPLLRENIRIRLQERMDAGLIDEVQALHDRGTSWSRLEQLGLEYRFVSEYLQGKIASYDELFTSLNIAIRRFAKRQETWFRGMERKGVSIHWLPSVPDSEEKYKAALQLIHTYVMH